MTVVNFWASWCAPCVQEHPLLVALKEQTGVKLYGVNYKDQAAAARRFLGRYILFTAVGVDGNGRAAIEWGVTGMPETFIVNDKGEIVEQHRPDLAADAGKQDHPPGARRPIVELTRRARPGPMPALAPMTSAALRATRKVHASAAGGYFRTVLRKPSISAQDFLSASAS